LPACRARAHVLFRLGMLESPHDASEAGQFRSPDPFRVELDGLALEFFPSGQDRLDAVLRLIAGAEQRLQVYYYVFAMDRVGTLVRDALAEAAGRGVAITLVIDDFGSSASDRFLAPLTQAGGTVLRFLPHWNVRYLIRNHQKMLIADGKVALIGGFNIEDAYFDPPEKNGWNDLGVAIEGEGVARLVEWFERLAEWTQDPKAQFRAIWRLVREWDPGEARVRWLIGGPTRGLSSWARCVLRDIQCGTSLIMMMAYFTPRGGVVKRIAKLARRGEASLLLAGKTDNPATIPASRSLYGKLLRGGATIAEFQPCKLHTKLVVVDDVTYVGSANFDMRSLYLNLELMLRIEDAELAKRMRDYIAYHRRFATEITYEWHKAHRGPVTWLRRTLAWFLVAVVDYTLTRRFNLAPLPGKEA